ncbi:polyketide synthase dehydratase domain-containing protein [Streptomyces sp. Y1]|uniref:Polyketide synthase dehydratase domain-containing protein n=1 Tax=Streptomyces sp. Y1 TaxID=3238634 RepID=A0AB39TXQ1_9ACTN
MRARDPLPQRDCRPGRLGPARQWHGGARGSAPAFELATWPPAGAEPVPLDGFYSGLAEGGYGYGPAFQGLRALWRCDGEVFAEVSLPDGLAVTGFGVHPALLDAVLQAIAAADRRVPRGSWCRSPGRAWSCSRRRPWQSGRG